MSWNYRVIRYEQGGYGLHEVYYDEAGKPNAMTEKPVGFVADEDGGIGRYGYGFLCRSPFAVSNAAVRS